VEAAIARRLVLTAAWRAQRKVGHGGALAVEGQGAHDGEAWPAHRAREQRIAMAPSARIAHLGQAILARRDVGGREEPRRPPEVARLDRERTRRAAGRPPVHRPLRRPGREAREVAQEAIERIRVALDVDQHALERVPHRAAEAVAVGQTADGRPEAHPLHDALDGDGAAADPGRRRNVRDGGHRAPFASLRRDGR